MMNSRLPPARTNLVSGKGLAQIPVSLFPLMATTGATTFKALNDFGLSDVAGVENKLDALKSLESLRPYQAMGVGNKADHMEIDLLFCSCTRQKKLVK